ncbi:hypothetical protein BDW_00800 [Bdellovibrio bacteriovorus W]|nr:hypothetical protein BDW_00800 [Bdellovibrio bacteriovorus W]
MAPPSAETTAGAKEAGALFLSSKEDSKYLALPESFAVIVAHAESNDSDRMAVARIYGNIRAP